MKMTFRAVTAFVVFAWPRFLAADVVLNGDSSLNGGAALNSTPIVSRSGGDGSTANPWLYVFSAPLGMGAYQVKTDNGESFTFDLGGNGLAGTSGATNLSTALAGPPVPGWITIVNAADIAMGGVITASSGSGYHLYAGNLQIGTSPNPVGNVRLDFFDGADRSTRSSGQVGTRLAIYGNGDVRIMTAGGVAGDLLSYGLSSGGGDMQVNHNGSFLARDVLAYNSGAFQGSQRGGNVVFTGNYSGGAPIGRFQARTIDTDSRVSNTTYCAAGSVTIRGYQSVRVTGNLSTYNWGSANSAGSVTITNISGDIELEGVLDASSALGPSYSGTVTLRAGGKIILAGLDLSKVKAAVLAPGAKGYIQGPLLNFPTGDSTNGLLDAPSGAVIYYKTSVAGNAYLGRGAYPLKSGGKLTVAPQGTVVVFR